MPKEPKFFCEHCQSEVRRDAMVCHHCGRFFASVRCPVCSFTGMHKDFKKGCPACGYAFGESNRQSDTTGTPQHRRSGYAGDVDPLPWWIYVLVLGLCCIVSIIFFIVL